MFGPFYTSIVGSMVFFLFEIYCECSIQFLQSTKRLFLLRAFNFNYYYNGSLKLFCNRHISAMKEFCFCIDSNRQIDNRNGY